MSEITFMVAECSEFHSMGEFYDKIETVEEAIGLYRSIDPSRMHGIPAIGVSLHKSGTESYMDEEADILIGGRIERDYLDFCPEIRDNPKVKDALEILEKEFQEG